MKKSQEEQRQWDEAIASENEFYKDIKRSRRVVTHQIANELGKSYRLVKRHIDTLDFEIEYTGNLSVVSKPEGQQQTNDAYGVFTDVYVQQFTGCACDDYYGDIYAKFAENKWLKIPFHC